jgi:hypothetical protein
MHEPSCDFGQRLLTDLPRRPRPAVDYGRQQSRSCGFITQSAAAFATVMVANGPDNRRIEGFGGSKVIPPS